MLDKKQKNKLVENLKEMGFARKEAEVYLALLTFEQPVGSSKIIRKTGLHGQYVYQALDTLESKGLARHTLVKNRKRFSANPPAKLRSLVEEKRILADSLAENLNTVFAQRVDQSVEMYEGNTAFIVHQYELLDEAAQVDEPFIDVIGGGGESFLEIFDNELSRYDKDRAAKEIPVRDLGAPENQKQFAPRQQEFGLFTFRTFDGLSKGLVDTQIRPTSLTFNIYGDPVISITVKNKEVAERYRDFFNVLWNLSQK